MLGFPKHLSSDVIFTRGASSCSHYGFNSGTEIIMMMMLFLSSFLSLSSLLFVPFRRMKFIRHKLCFHVKMSLGNSDYDIGGQRAICSIRIICLLDKLFINILPKISCKGLKFKHFNWIIFREHLNACMCSALHHAINNLSPHPNP